MSEIRGFRKAFPAFLDALIDQGTEFLKVDVNFADVNDKACLRVVVFAPFTSRRTRREGYHVNIKKIILLGGVGLVSAAAGILLPSVVMVGQPAKSSTSSHATDGHEAKPASHEAADSHKEAPAPKADSHAASAGHGGGGHGGGHGAADPKAAPKVGPVYLHFDHLVVNLNEPNLVKTLMLEISIKTDAKFESEVKDALDHERPALKTWLTSHVADKSIEDIRGKVGINRLRREIQDNFNSLMFKDGHERIQDILFEEWHVE